MKKIQRYIAITPEEALHLNFETRKNMAFGTKVSDGVEWSTTGYLKGLDLRHNSGANPITFFEKSEPDTKHIGSNRTTCWTACAKIEERHPRDVPEGITPLPNDKPFLAYLGRGHVKGGTEKRIPALWKSWRFNNSNFRDWENHEGEGSYGDSDDSFCYAIDVSDPWTKEHYPEFVEAMEYEPIYENDVIKVYNENIPIIGHKLDGKSYNLEWELVTSAWELVNSANSNLGVELSKNPPEIERVKFSDHSVEYGPPNFLSGSARDFSIFMAGEERGKWKATNWKYVKAEDAMNSELPNYLTPSQIVEFFVAGFNAARKTKDQ